MTLSEHCIPPPIPDSAGREQLHPGPPRRLVLGDATTPLAPDWERLDPEEVPPDRPLPFPANYTDALVLERPLDELTHAGGWQLIREAWRVLRPGGVFSFAARDFQPLLHADASAEALLHWLDDEESVSVWSADLLCCLLTAQGFPHPRRQAESPFAEDGCALSPQTDPACSWWQVTKD